MKDERKDKSRDDLAVVDRVERWLPAAVVVSALAGFSVLAWYAYNAGMQSSKEEDLLIVEAEKSPMKEKPLDPGGMKFPNQDKTIFETFSGGSQNPPKVERVLPAPEEPMDKDTGDNSQTQTWVNKNLHTPPEDVAPQGTIESGKVESIPQPDLKSHKASVIEKKIGKDDDVQVFINTNKKEELAAPAKTAEKTAETTAEAPKPNSWEAVAERVTEQEKPVAAPVPVVPEEKKAEAPKAAEKLVEKPAEKPATKPVAAGAFKVQLGAYRSDEEATKEWAKISKKYPETSGYTMIVAKADLGTKGVFYRLRLTGFETASEAKALCTVLSAKGQACMLPPE